MRRNGSLLALLVGLAACGGPPAERQDPPPDAVAVFDGGWLTLAEVERRASSARSPACRASRRAAGGGGLDDLLPCYREAAEALALERSVVAEAPPAELEPESLGERYPDLRQQVFLALYYRRLRQEVDVGDGEIEAHFLENRDQFRRPGRLTLWNIFRRHRDGGREETLAFLRGLSERVLAGEPFAALAREYSESETRLRDGLVGPVAEGKLPPRLERIAFALPDGAVSEPVPVQGGAVLLHVRDRVPGAELTLADVRQQIRRQLAARKVDEAVAERLAGRRPPPAARVLEPGELPGTLDGDGERVVLDVSGAPLTAAELRRLAGLPPALRGPDMTAAERERLDEAYRRQLERQLLLVDLLETADADLRAEAEAALVEAATARLVDERLAEEMRALADGDPEALRRHHGDNPAHYQSPLRFKLRVWDLPLDGDPPRQLERMEALREELAAGDLTLEAAAADLGGTVRELGWRQLAELPAEIPNKARIYLAQVASGGYSVPYQQDGALHLLAVEERQEPRLMSYEEVAEQVRDDYLERFEERLLRQVVDRRLAAAGFVFDDEAVERLLRGAPPGEDGES